MISSDQLEKELLDVGQAIGLFDDGANLQTAWFQNPLSSIESVLSNPSQRGAFMRLLDALLPPAQVPGAPANESWHPILGTQPRGNVYLTSRSNGSVTFGLAGDFNSTDWPPATASLRAQLPLIRFDGTTARAIAGTADGPLEIDLRIQLGWKLGPDPIGLEAALVTVRLAPLPTSIATANLVITLQQLQLDSSGARDVVLDPAQLTSEAIHLVVGLVREKLSRLAGATGEAAAVADHLLPLLGFGSDGIPPFPFEDISNPAALNNWFASLLQTAGTPPIVAWVGHLAGLLGSSDTGVAGSGTESDPWSVPVLPLGSVSGSGVALTLSKSAAASTTSISAGLLVSVIPSGATPPLRIEGRATLASIPILGIGKATVLPSAALIVRSPGAVGSNLVTDPTVTVGSMRAGFVWNGTVLQPLLELDEVTLAGTPYNRLDLTNTDSVAAAASAAVRNTIAGFLGNAAPGRNLAVLAGLIAPASDPATPHLIDAAALVANPARAIGAMHRSILLDGAHDWSHMLEEIASMLGLGGGVTGSGKRDDPWVIKLAAPATINLEVAAWNDQLSAVATDTQKLRLGLRISSAQAPFSFWWLAELLAFDLPQNASGTVGVMAAQHARLQIQPIPAIPDLAGLSVSVADFSADMTWAPGSSVAWSAGADNLTLRHGPTTIVVPSLKFPSAISFDVTNPGAIAAALGGVSVASLELLLRMMLARAAYSWGGNAGFTFAALVGVHGDLQGLPASWPTLTDPGGPGTLLSDPLAALRAWLARVAVDLSADGGPFLPAGLTWLRAFLSNALPSLPSAGLPAFALPISGSGTYEDPWALPLSTAADASTDALVWLEPAGPPPNWATQLVTKATAASDLTTLLEVAQSLGSFVPELRDAFAGSSLDTLTASLQTLDTYFATSDGVVPAYSQVPAESWETGTALTSSHAAQPADPAAVQQILAQIDTWAGGNSAVRTVLLLGPAFSDHNIWQTLLNDPNRHGTIAAGTNFDLRVSSVDPAAVDLTTVSAVADYYTADLYDGGTADLTSLTSQIGRIVARINTLTGSAKVILVGHSTAGVAARAFTAANAASVTGLITLGSPHRGAPLPFMTDSGVADAIRVLAPLRAKISADPKLDALNHVVQALDGYRPPASAGTLSIPSPYPVGSFADPGSTDTGGCPALALGSQLAGSLLDILQPAVSALANDTANPGAPPAAPTHLAFGIRAHLNFVAPADGQIVVDTTIRADAFRLGLQKGAAEPARPPHALAIRARLTNPQGWLVGASSAFAGPGLPPVDVRVRWAELGVDIVSNGSGGITVNPKLALHQVSNHGPVANVAVFTDGAAQPLLGAVLRAISLPAPAPTSGVGQLLTALQALGVAVPDVHGGIGISADAFAAVALDARAFLGPKLQNALSTASSALGFTGVSGGPWSVPLGGLPVEIYLAASPWTFGIRTTPSGSGSLTLASGATLALDGSIGLPNFQPKLDAEFKLRALSLRWSSASSQLVAQAAPWLAPLTLVPPPSAAAVQDALNDALPRMLFSSAASALLEAILGPAILVSPLDSFFTSTASFVASATTLGNSSGTALDPAKLTQLLTKIGQAAGLPAGPGLMLPGGLQLTASGAGTDPDPTKLQLTTSATIGGALQIALGVSFDRLLHAKPSGSLTLNIPLPAGWNSVAVAFAAADTGVSLVVTPATAPPIQILPTFSGLGTLSGAATALLPQALDAIVTALSSGGPPPLLSRTLDVATALGIYDAGGKFSAHANDLKALIQTNWLSGFPSPQRGPAINAIAALFTGGSPIAGAIPGSITSSGNTVTWRLALSGADAGDITLSLGWDSQGPTAALGLSNLKLGNGAMTATAAAGFANGAVQATADLGLHLVNAIGVDLTPVLSVATGGAGFTIEFYPLASGSVNGPIVIDLVPPTIHLGTDSTAQLIERWLLPLVADTLFEATKAKLTTALWTGGPTVQDVLVGAHIAQAGGGGVVLNPAIPDVTTIVTGLLDTLATGVTLPLTSSLNLALVKDANRLGVRVFGHEDFEVGRYLLSMRFGAPSDWGAGMDFGAALYLFDTGGGTNFTFNPGVQAAGLGIGLSGQDDAPLINTSGFRLGGVRLYSFFRGEFGNGVAFDSPGGGLELDKLGLPLGMATGSNVGGNNPVAASLLRSDGGDGNSGDTQAVNPGIDVSAWYWDQPKGDGTFHILFAGQEEPLWIGVHSSFGPIYIDQIGIILDGNTAVSLVLDASVKVDGLTGQAEELGVWIPFKSLTSPGDWSLDLKGLALSFVSPGVTISGALLKNDRGGVVEYDGMLLVQISEFGIVAVGAYSKPTDAQGDYTSIFGFAGVYIEIGIPPVIEIEALGLGVGYNRELIVPEDVNQVPSFILVKALDDGGALANDPMSALLQIRDSIPAKRGSFWLAVGLHGSTFVFVHVTAIVYVALDRGIEVGVLGVARMALPSDDTALVNVELALKARYSSAEGILSIQAQLTDNSYLFAPSCQLTGGFAYFMWFPQGQFVLTLGGYHPHFQKPAQFPDVPRLGFRWVLEIGANVKGESYFALTNTCVMAGGRLELTYGISCANVWFTAYADFLISWDPFYYDIDIGVSVGATLSVEICFFGCIDISITVSVGATLTIQGPPLHGTATIDLDVCSVTIAFGPDANPTPPYIQDWNAFAAKYLYGGDPNGNAFTVHALNGLMPPEPAGGEPAPGNADKPWKLLSEFSFQCDTKMPATVSTDFVFGDQDRSGTVHSIDIAPMNKESVESHLVVKLFGRDGSNWVEINKTNADPRFRVDTLHWNIAPIVGKVSEATWHWNDPAHMPAAANTLPAVTGLRIDGFAVTEGRSALIPIAKLVDSGNSRPLPFAVPFDFTLFKSYGAAAEALVALSSSVSTNTNTLAAQKMLAGSGFFASARVESGLEKSGLTPLATRALATRRSAPPQLAPITTGLTMQPVGLPKPPVVARIGDVLPVAMREPRLRAVLQARPQIAADAPVAQRTSVLKVAKQGVPRMAAPTFDTMGSRLQRIPAPTAARPTALARSARTLRSPELGWPSGTAHLNAIQEAAASFQGAGIELPAGTTHVWDIPFGEQRELSIGGDSAYRVTLLTRGGSPISDREYWSAKDSTIALPARCAMVAVMCLGKPGVAEVPAGFGAVSSLTAPAGRLAASGWQVDNLSPQVGATTVLGRGACLTLPQAHTPTRSRQKLSQAMVRLFEAITDQVGAETWLPPTIGVVMILLDQDDATAAGDGDLSLAVQGAALVSPPLRVLGGKRKALLYNVTGVKADTDHLTVGVASKAGWRVAGVAGLPGHAQEWAVRWNGQIPEQIVSDGPLTPDGSVTVRFTAAAGAPR